jgi:hypothetical protein
MTLSSQAAVCALLVLGAACGGGSDYINLGQSTLSTAKTYQ